MVQKWEYFITAGAGWNSTGDKNRKWLNEIGAQGWELVQGPSYLNTDYIFKRPVNQ